MIHSVIRKNMNKISNNTFKNSFLIVRHGESVWNHDSKFTGWSNIPLTEKGRKEAYNISQSILYNKLYPNVIFSSVLQRAIDTSNIIKFEMPMPTKEINIYTSWRLNERHYGSLEGIPRRHIREIYGDKFTKMLRSNFHIKPPVIENDYINEYPIYRNCYYKKIKNGESKENVLERLLPYYENDILYTLSENRFPLIVTHKHTIRVLMKHLLKITDEDFEHYELPNKKILYVKLDDNFNYESHEEIPY
jgi:2,3-bisphosphoglycerate-dependent phosphoglycerate mutase